MRDVSRFCLVVSFVVSAFVSNVFAQGWGMRRLEVSLTRKLPSTITFSGNTVKVRVDATTQGQVPRHLGDIFRTRLTAEVFKDSRVVEEKNAPDAVIEAAINEFSSARKPVQRSFFDPFTNRNNIVNHQIVSGQVTVSYRTLDGRDGKGLDAGNLRFGFEQEFTPTGEPYRELLKKSKESFKRLPTPDQINAYLIDGIVMEVTKRIVAVDESVLVPLPKGQLEAASKLGAAARWGAMLEAVERMPAFATPADEAYRQYAMAVANEALAYQESDRSRSQDLLAKAALGYKKAIQANPGENVFQSAQNRMANYVAPSPSVGTAGESERGAPRGADSSGASSGAPPGTMTNMDVIKFAREKFSEEFMIDAVGGAPAVAFDLSTDSLVELKRSGVSEKIIKAMRAKMAAKDKR
jgi:hypothetical protein